MTLLAVAGCVVLFTFDVNHATRIYITTMALATTVFTVMYALRANWRKTAPGRALMYVHASFAALSLILLLSAWLGTTYPGRTYIRLFLFMILTLTLVNMNLTLFRVQWWQHQSVPPPVIEDEPSNSSDPEDDK